MIKKPKRETNMKYSEKYDVRWHDTDAKRQIRPSELLVYMQETSNHHVSSIGMPLDTLRDEKKLAFILSKIRIEIYRRLEAYESIKVETWTCPSRGFSSNRCFSISCGGKVVAVADTVWALVGTEDRKFHKIDETDYAFDDEAPLDIGIPSRIRFPSDIELERLGERRIVYSDLDYNMHMNNTRYPDMLCDFMDIEEVPNIKGMTLSYLHEAAYGDTITVYSARRDNELFFRTFNQRQEVCLEALIVF